MIRRGVYGVVNVVLHPHPEGVYRQIFEKIAADGVTVNYFGDRYAKLSPLSGTKDGIFTGRLATWAKVDLDATIIDTSTLDEVLFEKSGVSIPGTVGFNSRIFNFAFRESDHKLFVELVNDANEKISVGMVGRIINEMLQRSVQSDTEASAKIVSQKSALAALLDLKGLRKVELVVDLPNPDVMTHKKDEMLASMMQMGAKQMRVEVTKKAGEDRLVLTEGMRVFAGLTSENGYAIGVGRGADGAVVEISTKEFPEEVEIVLGTGQSRAIGARLAAQRK